MILNGREALYKFHFLIPRVSLQQRMTFLDIFLKQEMGKILAHKPENK